MGDRRAVEATNSKPVFAGKPWSSALPDLINFGGRANRLSTKTGDKSVDSRRKLMPRQRKIGRYESQRRAFEGLLRVSCASNGSSDGAFPRDRTSLYLHHGPLGVKYIRRTSLGD